MEFIDRGILILKPKTPYVKWVQELSPSDGDIALEDIQSEPTAFLIPEFDSESDLEEYLKTNWRKFFEFLLHEWWTDRKRWPAKRDYKMFREWCEIQWSSLVVDVDEPDPDDDDFDE